MQIGKIVTYKGHKVNTKGESMTGREVKVAGIVRSNTLIMSPSLLVSWGGVKPGDKVRFGEVEGGYICGEIYEDDVTAFELAEDELMMAVGSPMIPGLA